MVQFALIADGDLALSSHPPDTAHAELADQIRLKLLPAGLGITNVSLLAESGNTARVAQLLEDEPSIAAFLKTIPVRGKATLLDTAKRWIAEGATLGRLERKREELEAAIATDPVDKPQVNVTRGKVIRLLALLQANLEGSSAPPVAVETIRGPIVKASERAAKRYIATPDANGGGTGTPPIPAPAT